VKMVVYLKSGASFEVDVGEFKTEKRGSSFESLNWTTPGDWTSKLISVDLNEVAALVAKREEAK